MASQQIIEAVATRIRSDERAAIDLLPATFGKTTADKLRVLIRYGLAHAPDVEDWVRQFDSEPVR